MIWARDDDLAWLGEVDKHFYTAWRETPFIKASVPFQLHLIIKDMDNKRTYKMIDLVFRNLKRMLE
jgi:hypothetical protein